MLLIIIMMFTDYSCGCRDELRWSWWTYDIVCSYRWWRECNVVSATVSQQPCYSDRCQWRRRGVVAALSVRLSAARRCHDDV